MATEEKVENVSMPIVIDLGKERQKRIRQLKRGRGRLLDEIDEVVEHVKAGLGPDDQAKQLVPIVMVYRKKQKRKGEGFFPFF
jgi:hypothetical protein